MAFSFSSFNKEFTFDLPEGLWNADNFKTKDEAAEKYGYTSLDGSTQGDVIGIIAFGVNPVNSPKAISLECGWIATEEEIINVPEHQIVELKNMLADANAVRLCKAGHMGAIITEYRSAKYGYHTKFEWCDR